MKSLKTMCIDYLHKILPKELMDEYFIQNYKDYESLLLRYNIEKLSRKIEKQLYIIPHYGFINHDDKTTNKIYDILYDEIINILNVDNKLLVHFTFDFGVDLILRSVFTVDINKKITNKLYEIFKEELLKSDDYAGNCLFYRFNLFYDRYNNMELKNIKNL